MDGLKGTQNTTDIDYLLRKIAELERSEAALQTIQDALKKQEEQYRTAFEYTGTAMLVMDENFVVLMANHRFEKVTGYPLELLKSRPKVTDFIARKDLQKVVEYHNKRNIDPQSVPNEYEFSFIHKNGEIRDALINISMIPGTQNRLISLVDISSRKQMEKTVLESEEKYRDLFENANDIIYTLDFSGNFTSANTAAVKTLGYSKEEICSKNFKDFVAPEHVARVMKQIELKRDSPSATSSFEIMVRDKNGSAVWVEISSRVIMKGGKPVAIQGIARNITDRKLTEEKLSESEGRFRETAELLPAIISEIDFNANFTYVNKVGLETFGYTKEDIEKGLSLFSVAHPDERDRMRQNFSNVVGGEFGYLKEYKMLKRDNTPLFMLLNASAIIKNGKISGVRACLVNITILKQTQLQLQRSEERFRNMFSESPIGIALFVYDGKIVDRNSSFNKMFPHINDSNKDKSFLFHLMNIEQQELASLKKGDVLHRETACNDSVDTTTKNIHRYINWHITAMAHDNQAPQLFLAQVEDITSRVLAEKKEIRKAHEEAETANRMVAHLKKEIITESRFQTMISRSPAMRTIFDDIPAMAESDATVLIYGESGTGKELIARSLHDKGSRKNSPFIAINCTAFQDTLLESELFGYKAGAFTDAKKDKPGKFDSANNGTLLLDEIGDITATMQAKLLRVLQTKTFEPVGGIKPVTVNVRVIAATNKNLQDLVKKGAFREDLFFRLNVLSVELPPLRDRLCDIPLLCEHFINCFNTRYRKNIQGLSDEALTLLLAYDFPGNIRELENIIERAFVICKESTLQEEHLSKVFPKGTEKPELTKTLTRVKNFKELERLYIQAILHEVGGNKLLAAKRMEIHKATLFRKLKEMEIENKPENEVEENKGKG